MALVKGFIKFAKDVYKKSRTEARVCLSHNKLYGSNGNCI
jgi:hypothetical protein